MSLAAYSNHVQPHSVDLRHTLRELINWRDGECKVLVWLPRQLVQLWAIWAVVDDTTDCLVWGRACGCATRVEPDGIAHFDGSLMAHLERRSFVSAKIMYEVLGLTGRRT